MSAVRLHYFNVRNRAEFIRWILAYKGVQFEDIRVEFADWPAARETFEFNQLPALEIDGKTLVTAIAIGRYVAIKYGLYPSDNDAIYNTESLIDFIGDFLSAYDKFAFKESNWAGWDEYLRADGVQRLKKVENRLKASGSGFFLGESATLVDFVVAAYVHNHYYLAGQEHRLAVLAQEVPALKTFVDHFLASLPAVAEYISTRPTSFA